MNEPWMPKGYHTITANLIVDDAEAAIAFLKRAFGAREHYRLTLSNGRVTHCELGLGDSVANLGETMEGFPAQATIATLKEHVSPEEMQRRMSAAGY